MDDGGFRIPYEQVKLATPDSNTPLTPELLELQKRLFSSVETLPEKFKSWVPEHQSVNSLLISRSQVQGLDRLNNDVSDTIDQIAVIGTTYANGDATRVAVSNGVNASPAVSVPAGTYFCILVIQAEVTDGAGNFTMQLYNSSGATAFGSIGQWSSATVPSDVGTILSIGSVSVTGTSNDIKATYQKAGAGNRWASNRFLIAMRTA